MVQRGSWTCKSYYYGWSNSKSFFKTNVKRKLPNRFTFGTLQTVLSYPNGWHSVGWIEDKVWETYVFSGFI